MKIGESFSQDLRTAFRNLSKARGQPCLPYYPSPSESARIAAWGIPVGLAFPAASGYYFQSLLLDVSPLDPLMYIASVAVAHGLTLAAAWIPACRASSQPRPRPHLADETSRLPESL